MPKTIFLGHHGSVSRDASGCYQTVGAGHRLCVEMVEEIEGLRRLIALYANHVGTHEGTAFLRDLDATEFLSNLDIERIRSLVSLYDQEISDR